MSRALSLRNWPKGLWVVAVLAGVSVMAAGCGRRLLSVVLDVPEKPAPAEGASPRQATTLTSAASAPGRDTIAPPIERVFDADSVKQLLPKDHAGNIDWMKALRSGVIRPRSTLPGRQEPPAGGVFEFGFDFYLPGPDPTFDAYFPHSSHTAWVACQQCHPRIFRQRNAQIVMADLFQGKFCGECHGKIAFPVATGCERCHPTLSQPANRASPDLLGDLQMKRVVAGVAGDTAAQEAASLRGEFPPSTFSHWVHRIRFQCKACHLELFEPKAGANAVTMDEIGAGKYCGACHDGKTAFSAGFGNCHRCHQEPPRPPGEKG